MFDKPSKYTKAALVAALACAFSGSLFAQASSPTQLTNQIELLKQQNSRLEGRIEELEHKFEQLKETSKQQYLALEHQLDQREGMDASKPDKANESDSSAKSSKDEKLSDVPDNKAQAADSNEPIELSHHENADEAYQEAFATMRSGDFAKASGQFVTFIKTYPDDKLTPNAWYWLGESHYIVQHYEQALQAFSQVVNHFPDSGKMAGAMLKKGYSEYALDRLDDAEATLKKVINDYPGSSSAELAVERLKDIQRSRE